MRVCAVAAARVTAAYLGQNLFRGLEREVVQEHHDLLPVGGDILGRAHDQRRGEQLHLLGWHMAVHPVRAGPRLEVVGSGLARREQGHRHVGHAVLRVGRDLPMPVYDRADVEIVGQIDPEPLSGIEHQSLAAGTGKAED